MNLSIPLTFDALLDHLRTGEPFTYNRFGDGEWACVLGHTGSTCDGQDYTHNLRQALDSILVKPQRYYLGMHTTRRLKPSIERWLAANLKHLVVWSPSELFHTAYVDKRILEFWQVLRDDKRTKIVVGPKHLADCSKVIGEHLFVEVLDQNAAAEVQLTGFRLDSTFPNDTNAIILFCAGPASCLLIEDQHVLSIDYEQYNQAMPTLIDLGSALDPFVGVHSRSFHRKLAHQYKLPTSESI